jgi:hypothetical protein
MFDFGVGASAVLKHVEIALLLETLRGDVAHAKAFSSKETRKCLKHSFHDNLTQPESCSDQRPHARWSWRRLSNATIETLWLLDIPTEAGSSLCMLNKRIKELATGER